MSEQPTRPLPRGRLILATLGSLALAALIVLGAILPAEFDKDPLGLGKLSGLSRLWAPDEQQVETAQFRCHQLQGLVEPNRLQAGGQFICLRLTE